MLLLTIALQAQAQTDIPEKILQMEQEMYSGNLNEAEMHRKYEELMEAYKDIDIEKTNFWFQKAIAYAREKENLDAEARCLARRGLIFSGMREKDSAAVYMDKAFKVIEGKDLFVTEKIVYEQYGYS